MTTSAEPTPPVVVDTTVLLAATDRSRSAHRAATEFLGGDQRRLALTPQIAREYLAVATRPVEANGFGLAGDLARGNLEQILEDLEILREDAATVREVMNVVVAVPQPDDRSTTPTSSPSRSRVARA